MIRLLIWALLIYIGYKIILALIAPDKRKGDSSRDSHGDELTHRDPVCGIYVTENDAVIGNHEGQRLYFCSHTCLEKYREQLDAKK